MDTEAWNKKKIKQCTAAQAIFLNPFTLCLSFQRKFVVCPFVYKETNSPFAKKGLNALNGLNGLAHLCQ
jgi:hypothetical protein